MPISLFISVALAASGPVGVALSSNRPGADPHAPQALARAEQALTHVGVPGLLSSQETKKRLVSAGYSDPRNCAGARKCLRDLALILGPGAVLVGVDVAEVADELVVHLEAVAADAEAPLAVKDVTVRLKGFADALVAPMTVFAREVQGRLSVPAAVVTTPKPEPERAPTRASADAPTRTPGVAPADRERTQGPLAPQPGLETRGPKATVVAGVVTGVAAVVAGALAVTFAVLAANDQAQWEASRYSTPDGQTGTTLSAAQADALVAQGNARYSVALGTGIGAGALAAAAVVLFTR